MRCPHPDHNQELATTDDLLIHVLEHQIAQEALMTEFGTDQAHLDSDVSNLAVAFGTAITELKSAIQNNPTLPAANLDFSKLDSLVQSVQAEAAADAPATQTPISEAPTTNTQANTGENPIAEAPASGAGSSPTV